MKFLRFLVLILAFTFVSQNTASAQGKGKGKGKGESHGQGHDDQGQTVEQRAQNRSKRLTTKLGLDANQSQQTYQVIFNTLTQIEQIKAGGKNPANHDKIKALRDQQMASFKTIFTADQFAKFQQMKEDRRDDDNDGNGPSSPPREPKSGGKN